MDNASLVHPQEEEFFVDSIHFTPEGAMCLIVTNIAQAVEKVISAKIKRKENEFKILDLGCGNKKRRGYWSRF